MGASGSGSATTCAPHPVGSFVHVPRGLPHCFQNVGDDAGRLLVTFTPAGMSSSSGSRSSRRRRAPSEAFKLAGAEAGPEVLGASSRRFASRPSIDACSSSDRTASSATRICRPRRPTRGSARTSAPSAPAASKSVLHAACPNCGGGFQIRPVRPRRAWRDGSRAWMPDPAGTGRRHTTYGRHELAAFVARLAACLRAEALVLLTRRCQKRRPVMRTYVRVLLRRPFSTRTP